jgi:hypothetical protein
MDPMQIGEAAVIVILGGWNGYKAFADYKAKKREAAFTKKFGLATNPRRCAEHASKINDMSDDIKRIKDHLGIV